MGARKDDDLMMELKNANLGGGFKHFWNFHPDPWGKDPI